IRPNHFTGPGRKHATCRKSDHRRSKGRSKARAAERLEEVLPANRPDHHREDRRRGGDADQPRVRFLDFRPDLPKVCAAKEKSQQTKRKSRNDNGVDGFPHSEKSASTIRGVEPNAKNALVVVLVSLASRRRAR